MAKRDERTAGARVLGVTSRIGSHRDGDICPVCKQAVDTVVKPRKVLGAYVPSYSAGPCHNPRCSTSAEYASASAEEKAGSRTGDETRTEPA
ncbi:hypothetical protein ACIBI4_23735 [Streptomyces sp. NPDC050418]|uniref:hypothetical protein n=1 Tax=Streptomyces sp. NPDC050418 TaxID=3365612 RepID=UPI00378E41EE